MTDNAPAVDFLVRRDNLASTSWSESPLPATLKQDEVLLSIDRFALTANNVTYAVAGDSMKYWDFFPAPAGFGRVPVWGFADVVTSNHSDVSEGERLYGYFPMSSHLVIKAGRVNPRGLRDMSEHRQHLAVVYNQYTRVQNDPAWRADTEGVQMLYRPLFTTSFLLDDFLAMNTFFGAQQIILTSASSKTSLGLAWLLKTQRNEGIRVIGLTSSDNRAFVAGTHCYDEILGYNDIKSLTRVPSVIVDMAGNRSALAAVHDWLDADLKYSCQVGATHWQALRGTTTMAGPRPSPFFAPGHIEQRRTQWGNGGMEAALAKVWQPFLDASAGWIAIQYGVGQAAVEAVWAEVVSGRNLPAVGHVLSVR
jgi:Protein of unknown function (DUF2855)